MIRVSYRIAVTKVPSGILVAIEDLAIIPNDLFIKDLYAPFSRRVPSSPLRAGIVDRSTADGKLDRRQDLVLPGEGAPDVTADIPDDGSDKVLPKASVCRRCSAPKLIRERLVL